MYFGGGLVTSDSITFYILTKGYKPEFENKTDTAITIFEGNTLTLAAKAAGRSPLHYAWIKGGMEVEGKSSDSLKFAPFTVNDTASYKCLVSNAYGRDTSRTFLLRYRPFSGGIKGVVTDTSGNKLKNAIVILSPLNNKITTDSTGSFAFSTLAGNSYTLKISLENYYDTALAQIAVNDTETIILPPIKLGMIATTTYTIVYNGNGNDNGAVPSDLTKYLPGSKIAVAVNSNLSKTGFLFSKWNTEKDGGGNSIAPGDSFTVIGNITFYAQWEALPTYNVFYNENSADSGIVPVDSTPYYKDKEVTVAGNPGKLSRDSYSFSGWNTRDDGTGESYNAGSKFPMPDSAVTLYVKWTTNPTYTITYYGTSASGGEPPAVVSADSGTQVTISDSGTLYKTGYSFFEWNTKEDGSGKVYKTGDKIVTGSVNVELFAQWEKASFTITYYGNGNTGGNLPPKTTHLYQTDITIASAGNLSKSGYSFVSWNSDSAGNGLDYQAGNMATITNDMRLYARWVKNKYKITFAGNGDRVVGVPDATEYEFGSKIDSNAVTPIRMGYKFSGWCKDSACSIKWQFSTDYVNTDDTLYAKWLIVDNDGNIYTEVKIGNQVWMLENLKVTKYNDGTPIPQVTTAGDWVTLFTPGYCWYNNDSATYNTIYGKLYNWYVVAPTEQKQIAPEGWHIPSDLEWLEMENYLILNGYNWDHTIVGNKFGKSLATNTFWNSADVIGCIGHDKATNNRTGFSAVPGGYRNFMGAFVLSGTDGFWWTKTENVDNTNYAWIRNLASSGDALFRKENPKNCGFSVRCIRD